jgi:hypothetical protein
VECCLRYASPHQRIFRVITATKTQSSRHQLRHAHPTRLCTTKLSYAEPIAPVELASKSTQPDASVFKLYQHEPYLRHSYHVARGRCKFFPGRVETEVGPWEFVDARPKHIQTRTMSLYGAESPKFLTVAPATKTMPAP